MKQTPISRRFGLLAALLSTAGAATAQAPAPSPTFTVLYTFQRSGVPMSILEVSPGRFMGVLQIPPSVFSITAGGSYKSIYTFPSSPSSIGAFGLTPGLNGQAYGGASNSGPVTTFSEAFSVALDGKVTTYPYSGAPLGGLGSVPVQSPDNHLYSLFGVVGGPLSFSRLDYSASPTPLFTLPKGGYADATFLGLDGDFLGLWLTNNAQTGGIFRFTPTGSISWIVPSFPTGGVNASPAGLMQASNGELYGTLPTGGAKKAGSIFAATLAGQMQTVYEFPHLELGIPDELVEASDGNLYGTAEGAYHTGYHGYSSIFRLDPRTKKLETIFRMKSATLAGCPCKLIQGSDGKIYGAAMNLGQFGLGTIFVLDAGLRAPKPHIHRFSPQSGVTGQKVLLWGRHLLGATTVSFNGAPAARFTVASQQGVWAEVPTGATSGPVTITTPNGSFTTVESFIVR